MAVAQPVQPIELPYKCGNCGMTHVVRNVAHGSVFYCTACGAQNQILLEHRRPTVVVYVATDVPDKLNVVLTMFVTCGSVLCVPMRLCVCGALVVFVPAATTRMALCRSRSFAASCSCSATRGGLLSAESRERNDAGRAGAELVGSSAPVCMWYIQSWPRVAMLKLPAAEYQLF